MTAQLPGSNKRSGHSKNTVEELVAVDSRLPKSLERDALSSFAVPKLRLGSHSSVRHAIHDLSAALPPMHRAQEVRVSPRPSAEQPQRVRLEQTGKEDVADKAQEDHAEHKKKKKNSKEGKVEDDEEEDAEEEDVEEENEEDEEQRWAGWPIRLAPRDPKILHAMPAILKCGLCHQLADYPQWTPCRHVFCNACMRERLAWHMGSGVTVTCPKCTRFLPLPRICKHDASRVWMSPSDLARRCCSATCAVSASSSCSSSSSSSSSLALKSSSVATAAMAAGFHDCVRLACEALCAARYLNSKHALWRESFVNKCAQVGLCTLERIYNSVEVWCPLQDASTEFDFPEMCMWSGPYASRDTHLRLCVLLPLLLATATATAGRRVIPLRQQ